MNRLIAVMEGFFNKKLIQKLAFYIDCVGKCKYRHWLTTCLRSCDMNAIGDACKFTIKR